jgi:hypothetical protein
MKNIVAPLETNDVRRPRVSYPTAYEAGGCTACGKRDGRVFVIDSGSWITRFCQECLDDIVRQSKWLKK